MLISLPTSAVFSLDDAMQQLFDFPPPAPRSTSGSPDSPMETEPVSMLELISIGPFARLVIVVTLLRGLVEYGEGKDRGGFAVQRWFTNVNRNNPLLVNSSDHEGFHEQVVSAFERALTRVRYLPSFSRQEPHNFPVLP